MARILFAAKDNGCASVTEQVAVLARNDGHEVVCAIEGLAMARYEKLGFKLYELPNFRGMVDFRAPTAEERRKYFNMERYVADVKPDVVVTGLGSPINIQRDIAEAATRWSVPLVVCEDFWAKSVGHLSHDKVNPEMILTVDEYSVELVKKAFPNARQCIVGNPGVKEVTVPLEVRAQMVALKGEFDHVCVYAGGGPESILSELRLLLGCVKKTQGKWCVIPGFHPKYSNLKLEGMDKPYGEIWREFLEPFSDCVRYIRHATQEGKLAPTDESAMCADLVASGFSTIMSTAVAKGVPAVCLNTPETIAALKAHGEHYTELPQVAIGIAPEVITPKDLSFALTPPSDETIAKIIPYDAKVAWGYIQELL